jgi:tetratricopeptide (TPR) repeat protein
MTYGQTFAARQLALGNFEQALALADQAIAADPADPEPVLDRAQALAQLGRHEEAVQAIQRCLELDQVARVIDDALLDDTLFSLLVDWGTRTAKAGDVDGAVAVIERYRAILPDGGHRNEVATWVDRFRGKREMWVKDHS